jgi:hypothetical protein
VHTHTHAHTTLCSPPRQPQPSKAVFTATGVTVADCPYRCLAGYSGRACTSSMQQVMAAFGGVVGFVFALFGLAAGILCCVGVLTRIRYHNERRKVRFVCCAGCAR